MGRFVSATGQFLLATYGQNSCPPMGTFSCPLTTAYSVKRSPNAALPLRRINRDQEDGLSMAAAGADGAT